MSECLTSSTSNDNTIAKRFDDRQRLFKTFFHRIGSTGMLNSKSSSSNSSSKATASSDELPPNQLYRSSSTSQLNTSSYVKCDDPTDGINLLKKSKRSQEQSVAIKSSSCDDIAKVADQTKRGFPYAFLRSKLSVLPEENGGSVLNQKRVMENNAAAAAAVAASLLNGEIARKSSTSVTVSSSSSTPVIYSRSNSMRNASTSTDECASDLSNSPLTGGSHIIDWDPTYQRLSSCVSSNESGYDSDGRHAEDRDLSSSCITINGSINSSSPDISSNQHRNQMCVDLSRRLSTCSLASHFDFGGTIKRRFRQIKLSKLNANDSLGITLAPQYYQLTNIDMEVRYLIVDIEVHGLAFRYF